MTLHDYAMALRKHWLIIIVLAVLGGGAAFAYSQVLPEQYRSESSVVVIPVRGDNTTELVQGSNYVQNLVQTYTVLATSPVVLNAVIQDLGLDETANRLARRVTAEAPLNTVIINISVTDSSPKGAQRTANAIASELAKTVGRLSPQGTDDQPAVRVETIAPAPLVSIPIAPNTRLNMALGALGGLAVGVAYALVRRRFGSRMQSAADVMDVTNLPVLGEVFSTADGRSVAANVRSNPDGRVAESLRQVAAGFKFVDVDGDRKVLMVTSGSPGEGKSSVSLSLALTLAEAGHSVLYLEADLRRASAESFTQLEGSVGLTTVLVGDTTLAEAAQKWGIEGLHVLTSGTLPPNPGQLLSSGRLSDVIGEARESYDFVIVDTAPVLSVSDTLWLSPIVDGVLLVIRMNKTKRDELRKSIAALESTRVAILGAVLNDAKPDSKSPYYAEETGRSRRWNGRESAPKPARA